VQEALRSRETQARGLVTQLPHPTAGSVPNVAFPMRFSDTPVVPPVAAPTLGQHTRRALAERLGMDDAQWAEAARAGAFGARAAKG
jgi:crotonobetainyl-CoA:carnitine CoA-transferase CaiB-like acyl-CoA transferase